MTDQASISGRASPDANALQAPYWERALLEKAVLAAVREQRASRRWKIFFRLFFLLIYGLMAWYLIEFSNDKALARGAHAALIVLDGEIAADQQTKAQRLNAPLKPTFSNRDAVAIILKINSPGGRPVQAGMV